MGDAGSAIVLDPSTGDVLDEGPGRVLGEYDGTIVRDGTTLEAVVGVLVYQRDGSAVRVHNGITGGIAQAYPQDGTGAVAVPHLVTEAGTGTLTAGSRTLLSTQRVIEEQG